MECPTCGETFSSRGGMRQHHTKVHDRRLPNRTCSDCGTRFYDSKSRREYCDQCDPNAGSNNGNWKDATSTGTCAECGTTFEYYPSNKDGLYCQSCVEAADGLLPENPAERMERVSTSCPACGTTHRVLQSVLNRRRRGVFCDLECYGRWLSSNVVGSDHHAWQGSEYPYTHGWHAIRRAARERDDRQCQVCGATRDELGQNPDVHHVTPIREFDDPLEAHRLENVVSLCRSCHREAEAGTVDVPRPERE